MTFKERTEHKWEFGGVELGKRGTVDEIDVAVYRLRFLRLGITDILGNVILCCGGCPVDV